MRRFRTLLAAAITGICPTFGCSRSRNPPMVGQPGESDLERNRRTFGIATLVLAAAFAAAATRPASASSYRQPPAGIAALVSVRPPPIAWPDPRGRFVLVGERTALPSIRELARPSLDLAGIRIDPSTGSRVGPRAYTGLTLREKATGVSRRIELPPSVDLGPPVWSPDGTRFAFSRTTSEGVELWLGDTTRGEARRSTGPVLNEALGRACEWMADGRRLLCRLRPEAHAEAASALALESIAFGPHVVSEKRSAEGRPAGSSTSPSGLVAHFLESQLAFVDAASGEVRPIGRPAVVERALPSPDGTAVLVWRIARPRILTAPTEPDERVVEVWDAGGRPIRTLSANDFEPGSGARGFQWMAGEPASVLWAERDGALRSGGNAPRAGADRLVRLDAPFSGDPREVLRLEYSFAGLRWPDAEGGALVDEYDRDARRLRTWLLPFEAGREKRLVREASVDEAYGVSAPLLSPASARAAGSSAPSEERVRLATKAAPASARVVPLRYARADGVELAAMLHLPAGEPPFPVLLWAYPGRRSASSASPGGPVALAVRESASEGGSGLSPLPLVTQGYAVLDVAMPIVGDASTANDSFVEQVAGNTRAALDAASATGLVDVRRAAVGGHSYGAFMTATLLAHTELFRAGIALSGAYNRTLTPFGFQTEQRSLWEAPDAYLRMSPFLYADRIRAPLLLVHGEKDEHPGTSPLQSEMLQRAIEDLGGTARLVLLPHEGHVYRASESILHTYAEMTEWLDRWVKHASSVETRSAQLATEPASGG